MICVYQSKSSIVSEGTNLLDKPLINFLDWIIIITSVASVSSPFKEKWFVHMRKVKEGGENPWQAGEGRLGTKQAATILDHLWKLKSSFAENVALSAARNLIFNETFLNSEEANKFIFLKFWDCSLFKK